MWQATEPDVWQGRDDRAESPHALRVFQTIRRHEVRPQGLGSADIALIGFASDTGVARNQGRTGAAAAPPTLRRALANMAYHPAAHTLHDCGNFSFSDGRSKAVQYILEQRPEVEEIHILGATGKRADHTVGNLSLLMEYPRRFELGGRRIDIVSDYGTAFALTDTATLDVGAGRRVSLFSPDNSLRIDSEGLVWPTGGVVFDNWWKATLNRAGADRITLRFSHPSRALVFLD